MPLHASASHIASSLARIASCVLPSEVVTRKVRRSGLAQAPDGPSSTPTRPAAGHLGVAL